MSRTYLKKIGLLVCAMLCFFALAVRAHAQTGKGTISGHVTDTGGGVLPGAQIELSPAGITAVTDEQGDFTINGVGAGTYTMTVSYVGFAAYTVSVDVKAGNTVRGDAVLKVGAQSEEVLVTAERAEGEAEAVNRQRTADNVLQVLPAEVIRSLPNANMADAIGRLPGVTLERDEGEGKYVQVRGTEPRLTNVTLDGVNVPSPESGIRQIKLDTIPADLVESVEINKTLQANQDADGIGGSVNLVTKTAGERPTVALSGMGGYTPIIGGRGVIETTGTLGQRFGTQKKLGILLGGSYDWNGRGIDDTEPVPDQATGLPGQPAWFDQADIREYQYYRSRWGLAGSIDYKLGEGSNLYVHGLYSDFKNFGSRWVYTLCDNSGNGSFGPAAGNTCTTPSFSTQIRRPDYGIGSIIAGGRHELTSTWFAWDLSFGRSRQIENGDPTASFGSNLSASNCQFDPGITTSQYRPGWSPACFTEAYNDPPGMTFSNLQYSHGETAQVNLQGTAAMGKRYRIGGHSATFEIGGRFRNAHKFDDSVNHKWVPNTDPVTTAPDAIAAVALSHFQSRFSNSNYYDGTYKLGPNPAYDDVYAYFLQNQSHFNDTLDPSAEFDLVEKVSAGYVMNIIDFSKFRFTAGLRVEGTQLDTETFTTATDTGGNTTVGFTKSSGSYIKVLPSASLRYALDSNTNLRLVYGRGLSRPDPQDIAQALTYDNSIHPFSASLGNPNLKAETADNVDVLVEHYLSPFGMIQGGFFYKNLSDPIVTVTSTKANFQPAPAAVLGTYNVKQPINAGSAYLYGFEAAYIQHLTFLPGVLRGFGISANYGYTYSETSGLPGRSDKPRLVRSAPHTWNVSPTFDYKRFSYRAGLSYNAANIFSYRFQDGLAGGVSGPLSDIYFYPHLQIDMQGSVGLSHGLTFVAYILNVNNEVFGFYQGSGRFMIQREYYQPTYGFGFRWNPTFEKK